jgi:hypothetical protein
VYQHRLALRKKFQEGSTDSRKAVIIKERTAAFPDSPFAAVKMLIASSPQPWHEKNHVKPHEKQETWYYPKTLVLRYG